MNSILKGTITIPLNSYDGSGEAILFLQKNNQQICDKVLYFKNMDGAEFDEDGNIVSLPEFNIDTDEFHHPIKVMMSCWQACIPSLGIHYDLVVDNG